MFQNRSFSWRGGKSYLSKLEELNWQNMLDAAQVRREISTSTRKKNLLKRRKRVRTRRLNTKEPLFLHWFLAGHVKRPTERRFHFNWPRLFIFKVTVFLSSTWMANAYPRSGFSLFPRSSALHSFLALFLSVRLILHISPSFFFFLERVFRLWLMVTYRKKRGKR